MANDNSTVHNQSRATGSAMEDVRARQRKRLARQIGCFLAGAWLRRRQAGEMCATERSISSAEASLAVNVGD